MREARHDLYEHAITNLAVTAQSIRILLEEEPSCEWEAREASNQILLAKRYLGKVGERLFCNWSGCPEEDEALSKDEGVSYFKGLVHPECLEKIRSEQDGEQTG